MKKTFHFITIEFSTYLYLLSHHTHYFKHIIVCYWLSCLLYWYGIILLYLGCIICGLIIILTILWNLLSNIRNYGTWKLLFEVVIDNVEYIVFIVAEIV